MVARTTARDDAAHAGVLLPWKSHGSVDINYFVDQNVNVCVNVDVNRTRGCLMETPRLPRLIRAVPPQLGTYIGPNRVDQKSLLTFLADSGRAGMDGILFDPTLAGITLSSSTKRGNERSKGSSIHGRWEEQSPLNPNSPGLSNDLRSCEPRSERYFKRRPRRVFRSSRKASEFRRDAAHDVRRNKGRVSHHGLSTCRTT